MAAGLGVARAHPPIVGVVPASVTGSLAPGDSMVVNKTVHTTAIPPLVDIVLVEDETASFDDDIATLKTLAGPGGPLITALDGTGANYATAVVGFRDFARAPWGNSGDWVYRLLANISPGGAGLVAGAPGLTAGGGGDFPEAQLEALHYLAVAGHVAIDSNGDGDVTDPNDTPSGQQPIWRAGSKRVVLLATDAACHVTGDPPAPGWPGDAGTTSAATTAGILAINGITVIGLTPAGAGTNACVDALAAGTAGTVHPTGADASTIVSAIMAGLGNLPVTVTPVASCDPGLSVGFDAASKTVTSGDDAMFVETITAASSATQGATLSCTVNFLVDGALPGPEFTQSIRIGILDVTPPEVACSPTTNPSGKNVPKAGTNPKSGQNPDGFYELTAIDNVDPNPQIFVHDSASAFVAGPFGSGTKIKLVQSPGGKPRVRPGAGVIDWKIRLRGDALVFAVDAAGNIGGPVSCNVPPPPK